MQYGTAKSPGPWKITFSLRVEPRCPGCAQFLQSIVVEFRDGWAWCAICVGHRLHLEPHLSHVLHRDEVCQCSTVVNGLRFYTPDTVSGGALTAYEWYERLVGGAELPSVAAVPDGAYGLTPSGEQLLAGLDVSELQKTERDLHHTNSDADRE